MSHNHKSWNWKKRSSHSQSDSSFKANVNEMHSSEKEIELERILESLKEKLESAIHENEAKDELLSRQAKVVEEASKGQELAEKAAISLRQELDKALDQKATSNERLTQLNMELKESMQQLSSIRQDYDQRIRDAVLKTSKDFEKAQKRLEEKLMEKSKNLANLILENAHLNKAVIVNERLIEDLSKRESEAEMGFNTLMARLDSVEKENTFLKYEFRVLEKELDIRDEESEFTHRQHMESVKKSTQLQNECQRLRVLVRRRFPGPVAIAKMKDSTIRNAHNDKKISALINRLSDMEGENRSLKEIIAKKNDELSCSLTCCARTTSEFSILTSQHEELTKRHRIPDFLSSKEFSPTSNENETKSFGGSEMSLMDDFVEMEKLAVVAVDEKHIDSNSKEVVPVGQTRSNEKWLFNVLELIFHQNHVSKRSFDDLLEDIRISLTCMKSSNATKAIKEEPLAISGYITWKSPISSPLKGSFNETTGSGKPINGLQRGTENNEREILKNRLRESEETIEYLEEEIEILKESNGEAEDQIVNQKLINEDLDTQLTVSKGKLNEVLQQLSALEVELEDRSGCYEELEGTCVELQLQLESMKTEEVPKDSTHEDEKLIQTGWEITAASAKLAECQETIFNLGKQLKALASPNETSVVDKKLKQRSSLRNHMLAEDSTDVEDPVSPKKKVTIEYQDVQKLPILHFQNEAPMEDKTFLAIVPSNKRGGGVGFWRKLLLRKTRGRNKKTPRICDRK